MFQGKGKWIIGVFLLFIMAGVGIFFLFQPLTAAEKEAAPTPGVGPKGETLAASTSSNGQPAPSAGGENAQKKEEGEHIQKKEESLEVVIGLVTPELGPYSKQGQEQIRGAEMAVEEINAQGGILGKKIRMLVRNSKSNPRVAKENALELFEREKISMLFGGVSSAVALTLGKVARQNEKPFFAVTAYSTDLTTEEGHKYFFRESPDSRMAAKALAGYLNANFSGRRFFYLTVDDNWGWTTEEIFRKLTDTTDKNDHRGFLTYLGADDYRSVLQLVQELNTEVLVLVLFGRDLEIALKQAYEMGLKNTIQIVVPVVTLDMALGVGPEVMEGVLSTTPWFWKVPFEGNFSKGMEFVKKYEEKYNRYPCSTAASAYVVVHQYKEAVERAKTFETAEVIKALEGHRYTGVKDEQEWRAFDHQSIQTVYAVRGKKAEAVKKDKYQADFFEVIHKVRGEEAAITKEEWEAARDAVSAPPMLEE
jgi:ABC-type branched-subunit amino acid transport system substrate-binding protein